MSKQDFTANLEYYKVFYHVARLGSLTAAAERLCLTQPTVTKAIQNLEEQLGCTLLLRTRRGVRLTREGAVLWKRVEPACHLLLTAERELAAARQLDGGSLSIASTEMSFRTYVLPALEQFTRDHPGVKVRFRNALTKAVLDMLQADEVDLAILHTPFPIQPQLEIAEIGCIEERFFTGRKFAFLAQRTRTLAELRQYPFVSVPEGSSTKLYAWETFRQQGVDFEADIEVTTIELVVQSLKSGLGIAMLPWEYVQDPVERGELFHIPVDVPPMMRRACVLTHRDVPPGPAAQVFLERYLPGRPAKRDQGLPDK